jgi:hypothetical protein
LAIVELPRIDEYLGGKLGFEESGTNSLFDMALMDD